MFEIITVQIIKMLFLLLLGILCYRKKLIDLNGSKALSNLLLLIISPVLAVTCLQTEYNTELVTGLLISFGISILIHGGMAILFTFLIRKYGNEHYAVERFSSMYSNCGFMGIPLVLSILGNEGLLYLTAYTIVFNVFAWSHGVSIMTGKTSLQHLRKVLVAPVILASVLGMILFFLRIRLPDLVLDTCSYITGMNTPIAMLIAGISVAQTNLPSMLKRKKLYLISVFKLLLMPSLVLLLLLVLPVPPKVACTMMVAASCPSGAMGTAFALRFQKDDKYAAELYSFTTICSLITVPGFVYAAEHLLM